MLLTPLSMAWQRGFLVVAFCHICKFHLCSELPACCWITPMFSEQCYSPPWWLIYAQKRHLQMCIYTLTSEYILYFFKNYDTVTQPNVHCLRKPWQWMRPMHLSASAKHVCLYVTQIRHWGPFWYLAFWILKLKHTRHTNLILNESRLTVSITSY